MAPTLRTLEWFFFGVTAQVSFQMFGTPEGAPTDSAFYLTGGHASLFTSVPIFMDIWSFAAIQWLRSRGHSVVGVTRRRRMVMLSLREHRVLNEYG